MKKNYFVSILPILLSCYFSPIPLNGPLAAFSPLYGVGLGGLSIKRGSAAEALRSLTIEESPRFMRGVLQLGRNHGKTSIIKMFTVDYYSDYGDFTDRSFQAYTAITSADYSSSIEIAYDARSIIRSDG